VDANEWIAGFAGELGVQPPDAATIEQLLDLAGVAAHASERLAAPIACYLAGLTGTDPAQALQLASRVAEASGG
jgi:hypothetical protein